MLTEAQRRTVLEDLEYVFDKAINVRKELDYLMDKYHSDTVIRNASNLSFKLTSEMLDQMDALRRSGAAYVQEYVTSWYMALHFDMSNPIKEVAEKDLKPPVYESILYIGNGENNKWELFMLTETHGRERLIVHSNTYSYCDVYSADKVINGKITIED